MRKGHKLRTYDKGNHPKHLVFVDTETTTIKPDENEHFPVLILGVAIYVAIDESGQIIDEKRVIFRTPETFWDWFASLISPGVEMFAYAHNWSYDLPVLDTFKFMSDLGFTLKGIVDASPPIILRYGKPGYKVQFIDNLNYFRQSLAKIGESLGYHKLEIDLDECSENELETYCIRDTEILKKAVLNLIQFLIVHGLSGLKPTVSSIAFATYIKCFKPCDIFIDASPERTAIGRKSYFGGRTECFRIGKFTGKFYLIDVNSQYPFVMRNNDFPVKAIKHHKRVTVRDIESIIHRYCVTIKCDVETTIPVFPKKIDDRTCFPVGSFTTYLSTPEVIYGLDNDLITKVHEVVVYEQYRIFESYVDYFYNMRVNYRSKGNETYQLLCKLLMNSLYGKYGQMGQKWIKSNEKPRGRPGKWFILDEPTKKRVQYMEIDNQVWVSEKETESKDSFPAIAAHVTAYGRILMQRMMDYIGRQHIYYCDTDSLIIDQHAYNRVKDKLSKTVLGCWSLDGEADRLVLYGAKDYEFGSKKKIKGIRAKHVLTEDGLYRQLQFSSLRGSINKGILDKPVIKHTHKALKRVYLKGNVDSEGVVTPFVLYPVES